MLHQNGLDQNHITTTFTTFGPHRCEVAATDDGARYVSVELDAAGFRHWGVCREQGRFAVFDEAGHTVAAGPELAAVLVEALPQT